MRSDWKVTAILNRDALEKDIHRLISVMKRQRVWLIVSAESEEEALREAERRLGIDPSYLKALHPRRLKT